MMGSGKLERTIVGLLQRLFVQLKTLSSLGHTSSKDTADFS